MDANDVVTEVENLIAQYDNILSTYSPATLKDAVKNAWSGEDKIEELLMSLAPYKEKGADKQRLISMKKAMTILRELEEQLVGSLVPTYGDVLFNQLFRTVQSVASLIVNLKKIWDARQATSIIVRVWRLIGTAMDMSNMVTTAKVVFAVEQRFELNMENLKMRQNKHARRQRVKKITRR